MPRKDNAAVIHRTIAGESVPYFIRAEENVDCHHIVVTFLKKHRNKKKMEPVIELHLKKEEAQFFLRATPHHVLEWFGKEPK